MTTHHTYTLRETYGQVRAYPTSEELVKALPLMSGGKKTLTREVAAGLNCLGHTLVYSGDLPEAVDPIYPYGHRSA